MERFADQPPSASPLPWSVPTGAINGRRRDGREGRKGEGRGGEGGGARHVCLLVLAILATGLYKLTTRKQLQKVSS